MLVKEERVFAEQVVEFCNHGVFVRNNVRFELIQGSLDLRRVEFHRALLFPVCSKVSPLDIAGCGPTTSRWSNATYAVCVHGQVTTTELNEPVAPEFRTILPDELFQTVEKLFRSSRYVFPHATLSLSTCHAFDMPRLLNQRELFGISGNYGPATSLTFDPAFRDVAKETMMRVLMLPAAAAILLIGADLLCAPAANAQVQSPSPGATAQPSNIPDQKLDAAAAAVERVTTLTQD